MGGVAGHMATQIGARYLGRGNGGRGSCSAAPRRRAGAGRRHRRRQRGLELGVDRRQGWRPGPPARQNLDRLRFVDQIHRGGSLTLASNRGAVERAVASADLVIGAVLVPGGRAPTVVTGTWSGA